MLGVSRSSVREALQGLAAMDLVETRPGEGTFVKEPKHYFGLDMGIETLSSALQKEMRHHLNQARLVLEQGIVSLAAEQITEASSKALLQALQVYEAPLEAVSSEEGNWSGHDQLHLAIAEATGNPILVRILHTLLDLVPMTLRNKGSLNSTSEEAARRLEVERNIHRQMCEAVIRGDGPDACEWMARHAEHEEQIINHYYGSLENSLEGTRTP